jgi:flagellar protein FlgJ
MAINNSGSLGSSMADQQSTLDMQGIDKLRLQAKAAPQGAIKQVARQFEAMFMQMVLKSMRDASPQDGLFDSQQSKLYTSMFDQQLSQNLSGHGVGLADALQAQLGRFVNQGQGDDGSPVNTSLVQQPSPLNVAPQWSNQLPRTVQPDLSVYQDVGGGGVDANGRNANGGGASAATVDDFVSRMGPSAQAASDASGVPAQLILAQAALESGWGKREIRGSDGASSHNLFGIKATHDWKGPTVQVATTEYVDGVPQKTVASFRAYGSYDEAFADYAQFLTANPRYAGVLSSGDPEKAAHGLQRAGYATDPEYGNKLVRIMRQVT